MSRRLFHSDPAREKLRATMLAQIAKGGQIAIASFIANLLVGVFEVGFGTFYGSLALSADGIHSFVDAIVSLMVWLGIRYSQRRADGKFHYGYYKFDAIFSLFAAMIMVASGVIISYIGVTQFLAGTDKHPISVYASVIAGVSILIAVVLAIGKNLYARKSGLVSLKTDAYNSIKDATASIVALLGIVATWFGFYGLDPLAGLIIGAFVMVAGYFSIHSSSLILADAYSNPQMIETIKRIATSVPGIEGIDDLRIRRNGPFLTVEMHIRVDGNITVFEADKISKEVTQRMRERILSLGRVTVKPEPVQTSSTHPARQ
jgi:cation diffusion facilitator family transporter